MKFRELIEATAYIDNIKKSIKDSLIALKIQGVKQIETDQVLRDFNERGLTISFEELANFIGNEPMVNNINKKFITFKQPSDNINVSSQDKVDSDKAKVQQLSKKSLKKEFK